METRTVNQVSKELKTSGEKMKKLVKKFHHEGEDYEIVQTLHQKIIKINTQSIHQLKKIVKAWRKKQERGVHANRQRRLGLPPLKLR